MSEQSLSLCPGPGASMHTWGHHHDMKPQSSTTNTVAHGNIQAKPLPFVLLRLVVGGGLVRKKWQLLLDLLLVLRWKNATLSR